MRLSLSNQLIALTAQIERIKSNTLTPDQNFTSVAFKKIGFPRFWERFLIENGEKEKDVGGSPWIAGTGFVLARGGEGDVALSRKNSAIYISTVKVTRYLNLAIPYDEVLIEYSGSNESTGSSIQN